MTAGRSLCKFAIALGLVMAAAAAVHAQSTQPGRMPSPGRGAGDRAAFAAALDVESLGRLAVYHDGRVKSLESFAREMTAFVCGHRAINGQPPLVTYFDLMFRPEAYADADVIFVKNKLLRTKIAAALRTSMGEQMDALRVDAGAPADFPGREDEIVRTLENRLDEFRSTGLISEPMLMDSRVRALLARLETDLLRGAKFVRMIDTALAVKDPAVLAMNLRLVPPVGGGFDDRWLTPDEFARTRTITEPGLHIEDPSVAAGRDVVAAWGDLRLAWDAGDAGSANAAAAELAEKLPTLNRAVYPDSGRLAWESWYFRMRNMTWVWIVYALSLIPLILHTVFRWPGARWLGLLIFSGAFALQTFTVMLRWYVAGRWPNTNMFEAVTTAAWFGGCFAIVLEIVLRRTPVRGLFAVGSGAASTVALMAAHFLPLELNAALGNRMPVLHDVWLYIHTNVIIFSYCLIFIAAVSAGLYLAYRAVRGLAGKPGGTDEYARVGGAGSLIVTTPDGVSSLAASKTTLGQILDGTTMIVLELSFILLWTGLVMGAIWADHSWGRPWGWDPKEVFALNTFLIFALLIHTRLKVRDKGLWTALLAIAGCGVMLFNWIVINFTISGLHSYA